MPRRKQVEKRPILPDPKFSSTLVTQFVNALMQRGKKSVAEQIFYGAVAHAAKGAGKPGLEVFQQALNNVKPVVEVKSRRVGGSTYQVPVEVRSDRRVALGIRWLILYASSRGEHTMAEKLGAEMMAAAKGDGAAVKKKEDTHRMAEANKAFAHYRW
jgi:small subunit ribosomal protein S7